MEIEITNSDTRELEVVINLLLQPTEIDDAGKSFDMFKFYFLVNPYP